MWPLVSVGRFFFYIREQFFFTIAGNAAGLLVCGNGAEAIVEHLAKLCKKENEQREYGDFFFQTVDYKSNCFYRNLQRS